MYNAYIVMFLVGVLYTFVSIIISGISGAFHAGADIGHHIDIGHHVDSGGGHMGHHIDSGNSSDVGHHINGGSEHAASVSDTVFSWFSIIINPIVAVSFLTVLGGLGIIGLKYLNWSELYIFIGAFLSAVLVSTLLYRFVAIPIYRSENTSDVSRKDLVGVRAEVTSDIIEGGFGTINYSVNSILHTSPSKHIDGKAVKQGTKVFICKVEDNIFFVSEAAKL